MLTELLILGCWYALLFLRKFDREASNSPLLLRKACNVITKQMYDGNLCYIFLKLPSCLPSHLFAEALYWKKNRESGKQTPTDRSEMLLLFYCMMDWPYRWPFWQSWQTHLGLIWSGFFFWFLETSYLRVSWVESISRRKVQRGDDTPWLQVIISAQTRATHQLLHHLSWLPLQTVCMHFGLFIHFDTAYCWLFGLQLPSHFLFIL